VTFLIDGDRSITNPSPRGTFNHGDLILEVETGTNAECRYLYSVEDREEFWQNRTFDPAVFENEMAPFTSTGSEASPTTIHRSNVNLGHGYHRYYIKCFMFADQEIRGNNGDQIRFAVDLEPPLTQHSTNIMPYNSWYNEDLEVSLICSDPPIDGEGLEWSFGCNTTFYCKSENCADFEDEFKEYDEPIKLNETTYLTYYSVDLGGNIESPPVENILFQVDKENPQITVEFLDGETPVSVLVMNIVYKVRVSSSKPFISPAVDQPYIIYGSAPSKFAGEIDLLPTVDPAVWEGVFFLESINANKGYEGEGTFTAFGVDYHNVTGSGSTTIAIDTKPPDDPVIEPSLDEPSPEESDYQSMGYPVNYQNGTYYTNQENLFITGFTNEYLDMITVTSTDNVVTEYIFTQTPTHLDHEDIVISGFEGTDEIRIFGDLTARINNTQHIGFDNEQTTIGSREIYGAYGMFYDITNIIYHGGDDQYTEIRLAQDLEENLPFERDIFFYDKENPSYWFGFDVPLTLFQNTSVYLKAYDDANNMARYPPINIVPPYLVFFSDPIPPIVLSHYPRDGSTSKTEFDLQIIVREGRLESGIFEDSLNITVNNDVLEASIEHDEQLEAMDPNNYYYKIYFPVPNAPDNEYEVSIEGTDLATNPFNEDTASSHWTFIVDRSFPADPYFRLVDGFPGPPGSDRWYADHSPDFIIDFSDEPNPVTIVDVMMEATETEGGAANCTNTSFNIFLCKFTTPKSPSSEAGAFWADYGVIIKAFKTLDDDTDSPTGEFGPFQFTVDDQAPIFAPDFQRRFMDNINLTIGALVTNEHHPLHADMEILGEHYNPIYSSNDGAFYYFTWEVPDYTKEDEGDQNMTITLFDFAGNKNSVTVPVYIDLTAPRLENVTVDISNTIMIGEELFTASPNVTISGNFIDDDIAEVWIVPGDYDAVTQSFEGRKSADITYVDGVPQSFSLSVRLLDPEAGSLATSPIMHRYMLINQVNNMTLFARDLAGHVSHKKLSVISDIAPPLSVPPPQI
jgi:hypothetical protein